MCMWAGMGLLSCVLGVVTCHNTSYLGRAQSVPRKAVPDVAPPSLTRYDSTVLKRAKNNKHFLFLIHRRRNSDEWRMAQQE